MLTRNELFRHLLEEMIDEQIKTLSDNLTSGSASDYPDYRFRVGQVRGLRDALDRCADVATEIAKRHE